MNAVIIAIVVMLALSLLRVNVVLALVAGAIVGGFTGGLSVNETIVSFTGGLGEGATIALSYALLGGFAVAISKTGIPQLLVAAMLRIVKKEGQPDRTALGKVLIVLMLLAMAIFSQNLIPIHIAFIPLLVPPIIHVLNMLKIDRRLIASVLTFGLTAPYILLPYGYGFIFHEILAKQMAAAGMAIDMADIPKAMALPVLGMFVGLLIAIFFSYRDTDEEVERHSDDSEPFSALAFKVMTDPYVGKLTFFRVYSGVLQSGSYVQNSSKGKRERVGRILQMHANSREEISEVHSGEIAAAVGLKDTGTGDTLCEASAPVILESMDFPEPVISLSVEPKTKADQDKMGMALAKLQEEDPTFRAHTDQETGEVIIAGMGELHLDVLVDRMRREFNVEANVGAPQVSYRETFRESAEVEGKFVRQSGGRGQFGHVWIEFSPNEEGKGFEFINNVVGGSVPREYIPAVEAGIRDSLNNGVIAGYPLIDIKARLFDGSYHDVDSNEMAFKIAASMALKNAVSKVNPVLLEPMMKVEVQIPEEYMGDIMGDVTSRRGRVEGMDARGNSQIVRAMVPLANMFGYATSLRSNTQGRGNFSMTFDHYEEVPKSVAEEIIKKNKGE